MKHWSKAFQISCTYIGTMVGAGFASGQEILQFFTIYGWTATLTIGLSSILFIWIGTKQMLLAHHTGSKTYEDLNRLLFGERFGKFVSYFMAIVLFGTVAVMLAGAGSIFSEHFHLPYQWGLLATIILGFVVLIRGMDAILTVNTIIVPIMIVFTGITVWTCMQSPGAGGWLVHSNVIDPWKVWLAPFLYSSLNLCLAQAVLVPIGASVKDPRILRTAGILGGVGMGILLFSGHFALSTQMPGIAQFEIPMAFLIHELGPVIQFTFLIIIYAEIFTTLIANAFGLAYQLGQRLLVKQSLIILTILVGSYLISQIGFSTLVSTLYPMFGLVSLGWMFMVIRQPIR
jgi:uncharacterized membrane protein YkvI